MKKPALESGLLSISTNGLPTTLSARRGLYHRAEPEAKPMASTKRKVILSDSTMAQPRASFSMYGNEGEEGLFVVRPGVATYDAIETAQGLLSIAHTLALDGIQGAQRGTNVACGITFVIGAVQAIHTSIGFEV
jgi:hypothetical protein